MTSQKRNSGPSSSQLSLALEANDGQEEQKVTDVYSFIMTSPRQEVNKMNSISMEVLRSVDKTHHEFEEMRARRLEIKEKLTASASAQIDGHIFKQEKEQRKKRKKEKSRKRKLEAMAIPISKNRHEKSMGKLNSAKSRKMPVVEAVCVGTSSISDQRQNHDSLQATRRSQSSQNLRNLSSLSPTNAESMPKPVESHKDRRETINEINDKTVKTRNLTTQSGSTSTECKQKLVPVFVSKKPRTRASISNKTENISAIINQKSIASDDSHSCPKVPVLYSDKEDKSQIGLLQVLKNDSLKPHEQSECLSMEATELKETKAIENPCESHETSSSKKKVRSLGQKGKKTKKTKCKSLELVSINSAACLDSKKTDGISDSGSPVYAVVTEKDCFITVSPTDEVSMTNKEKVPPSGHTRNVSTTDERQEISTKMEWFQGLDILAKQPEA